MNINFFNNNKVGTNKSLSHYTPQNTIFNRCNEQKKHIMNLGSTRQSDQHSQYTFHQANSSKSCPSHETKTFQTRDICEKNTF